MIIVLSRPGKNWLAQVNILSDWFWPWGQPLLITHYSQAFSRSVDFSGRKCVKLKCINICFLESIAVLVKYNNSNRVRFMSLSYLANSQHSHYSPRAPRPSVSARSLPGPELCSAHRSGSSLVQTTGTSDPWLVMAPRGPTLEHFLWHNHLTTNMHFLNTLLSPKTNFSSAKSNLIWGLFHQFAPRSRREWGRGGGGWKQVWRGWGWSVKCYTGSGPGLVIIITNIRQGWVLGTPSTLRYLSEETASASLKILI